MQRRQSVTFGTPAMIVAIVDASRRTGQPYGMVVRPDDLAVITFALATAAGIVSWDDAAPEMSDRAKELLRDVGVSLGIQS